ncbi:MAG: hypothetical protein FJ149_05355 [Euryarchaeota archaeon]|nr:hypothetical protein [Euryarchaeota archaeon]
MDARRVLAVSMALLVLGSAFPSLQAGPAPAMARVQDNDNDMANATACESGKSYNGTVDVADDPIDLFAVSTPAAGQVFAISLHVPSHPSPRVRLSFMDRGGKVIDESALDGPWQSLSVQAVKGSTNYYVSVNVISGAGNYTLYYTLETPPVIAPLGSFTGLPLERASPNPCDWYAFSMSADTNNGLNTDVAEFTVDNTQGMVLDVTIHALWIDLAQFAYNISLDHRSGDMISAGASYTGTYYVRLWARSGSGTYNISLGVLQSALNDNDNIGTTATKLNNTAVSSWVDQSYDHYDFYKVYLLDGEKLDVNLTLNQHTEGRYGLWLLAIVSGLYTIVTTATNYVPGVGWTDKVRLTHDVTLTNRYYIVPMAECGLDAGGNLSSVPANASYTLKLGSPADINHAPILGNSPGYPLLQENTPAVIFNLNVIFEDPDGDQLFFNVTGTANLTTKILSDGSLHVTPATDWAGGNYIKICATDVWGAGAGFDVFVTVENRNQPPRVNKVIGNVTLQEDQTLVLDLKEAFVDPDIPYGDHLVFWWTGNGSIPVSLDNYTLELTLGPVHGILGSREITLNVRDSKNARNFQKFLVTINHTNHPPQLAGAARIDIQMPEDGRNNTYLVRDFFKDEDTTYAHDVLTYTGLRSEHINCTVGADGRIDVRPDPDWSGQETVFVVAEDTGGLNVSLEVRVVVDPVNDPPYVATFSPDAEEYSIFEMDNLTLSVEAGDIDTPSEQLTYQWFVDGIKAGSTAPSFTFVTDQESSRQLPYNITVEIRDGQLSTAHTWAVPVLNRNQPPVVNITSIRDGQVIPLGAPTLLRAEAYDAEHDNLAYTWKDNGVTIGVVRSMNLPNGFSPGWHIVSVHVYDGTDTAVVNVTIFSDSKPSIVILTPDVESKAKTTDNILFSARVFDEDGDPVTLEWREGDRVLSREANFTKKLGRGLHYIKINASDGRGYNESSEIVIRVEEPPKSGFIPGTETLMVAAALAAVGALAALRRRRTG